MINVAGVRFQNTGKSYYFDPQEYVLRRGMHVIVETAAGEEYGTVTIPPILVQDDRVVQPLRPVLRIATEEDEEINAENQALNIEAGEICKEKIKKHGLEMKLVSTEYAFDRSKLMFYFTADGRVDFRELVKELASVFRTRIELRQIGVRDEAKIKGGMGMCGRELCCTTFLSDFAPVSIRMAKEQNLSLNPTKISGTCGRLMCCLKNEQETYEYLNKKLPKNGQKVKTIDEFEGTVHSVNILKQTVKVMIEVNGEKEIREYASGELAYGDKDFECEPRRKKEDELDYFSEQLKKAVAAAKDPNEEQAARRGKNRNAGNRSKNRQNAANKDGAHAQDNGQKNDTRRKRSAKLSGEQKQGGAKQSGTQKQSTAKQDGSEKRSRNDRRRNNRNPEERRNADAQTVNPEERRRNTGNRKPNSRRSGANRNAEKADIAAKEAGKANSGAQNAVKHGSSEGQDGTNTAKNSRSRSRYRGRGNRNREGKPAERDTTETKQSDT